MDWLTNRDVLQSFLGCIEEDDARLTVVLHCAGCDVRVYRSFESVKLFRIDALPLVDADLGPDGFAIPMYDVNTGFTVKALSEEDARRIVQEAAVGNEVRTCRSRVDSCYRVVSDGL